MILVPNVSPEDLLSNGFGTGKPGRFVSPGDDEGRCFGDDEGAPRASATRLALATTAAHVRFA
jgi:hypothetical protein